MVIVEDVSSKVTPLLIATFIAERCPFFTNIGDEEGFQ